MEELVSWNILVIWGLDGLVCLMQKVDDFDCFGYYIVGYWFDFGEVISICGLVSCLIWFMKVVWLFVVWKWLG